MDEPKDGSFRGRRCFPELPANETHPNFPARKDRLRACQDEKLCLWSYFPLREYNNGEYRWPDGNKTVDFCDAFPAYPQHPELQKWLRAAKKAAGVTVEQTSLSDTSDKEAELQALLRKAVAGLRLQGVVEGDEVGDASRKSELMSARTVTKMRKQRKRRKKRKNKKKQKAEEAPEEGDTEEDPDEEDDGEGQEGAEASESFVQLPTESSDWWRSSQSAPSLSARFHSTPIQADLSPLSAPSSLAEALSLEDDGSLSEPFFFIPPSSFSQGTHASRWQEGGKGEGGGRFHPIRPVDSVRVSVGPRGVRERELSVHGSSPSLARLSLIREAGDGRLQRGQGIGPDGDGLGSLLELHAEEEGEEDAKELLKQVSEQQSRQQEEEGEQKEKTKSKDGEIKPEEAKKKAKAKKKRHQLEEEEEVSSCAEAAQRTGDGSRLHTWIASYVLIVLVFLIVEILFGSWFVRMNAMDACFHIPPSATTARFAGFFQHGLRPLGP
uniref:Transmembrane protein n=1 Tax=Chromera velia CCMP2878 TaxID=1169474 RepID=A0A0G4HBA6_9ALVE|eukprot:Cvel_6135.t1-p1 / transcript=Cvel_6135.t1 / gene=Cvel_6135 / organism=Chromera_velia_CCMP2878 / gene_product=hypothetical protein / transcript_product=hypothetical protein / location=Cvel_scaffold296:64209-65690(-) / protein_length=494 / sequence_SO=supercontig / SO=protein_coding / is_pseudo=false